MCTQWLWLSLLPGQSSLAYWQGRVGTGGILQNLDRGLWTGTVTTITSRLLISDYYTKQVLP